MLQNIIEDIEGVGAHLRSISPLGYTLAINIRYFTPEFYISTFPSPWVEIYTSRRYALFDPVILWSRFNVGTARWSEIEFGAIQNVGKIVMDHAEGFGLRFGGVAALQAGSGPGIKSILCGSRADRELSDQELLGLLVVLEQIVAKVGEHAGLSEVELEMLRDLAQGMTHNEIADVRAISPATVKKRLERARVVLGAKNAVHAVAIATKRGLILPDPMF